MIVKVNKEYQVYYWFYLLELQHPVIRESTCCRNDMKPNTTFSNSYQLYDFVNFVYFDTKEEATIVLRKHLMNESERLRKLAENIV